MPSKIARRPVNAAPEAADDLEAEIPLSVRLERLGEAHAALVWPERVTRAMVELKHVTERVTGLMQRVSGDASSLGDLATAMDGEAVADDAPDDAVDPAPSDFDDVAQRVAREIDACRAPPKWVASRLSEMRAALVAPYVLEVADARDRAAAPRRPVVIVASDADRALLAFDPDPQGDFVVVWRRPNDDVLSNIRGGAVECFLAI
jgi:hypothetical protein